MVDPARAAFEPRLELLRILTEIVQQTGDAAPLAGAELGRALAGEVGHAAADARAEAASRRGPAGWSSGRNSRCERPCSCNLWLLCKMPQIDQPNNRKLGVWRLCAPPSAPRRPNDPLPPFRAPASTPPTRATIGGPPWPPSLRPSPPGRSPSACGCGASCARNQTATSVARFMSTRKRIESGRHHVLAGEPGRIGEGLSDVFRLEAGVGGEDRLGRLAFGDQAHDRTDRDPHATDAGASAHLAGLEGDAVERSGLRHHRSLPLLQPSRDRREHSRRCARSWRRSCRSVAGTALRTHGSITHFSSGRDAHAQARAPGADFDRKTTDFGRKLTHGCVTCVASRDFTQFQRVWIFLRISGPRDAPDCGRKTAGFGRKSDAWMRHVAHRHWIGDLVRGPIFRKFPELLASSDSGPAPPPARTGGRRARGEKDAFLTEFQSTPPRRGRREVHDHHALGRVVSIHAPTRGATPRLELWQRDQRFQSTPPRRGRPHGHQRPGAQSDVSIHAPTKGATPPLAVRIVALGVSIHAPTKGATGDGIGGSGHLDRFNPRPHGGGDRHRRLVPAVRCAVSIHAPTRGATLPFMASISG